MQPSVLQRATRTCKTLTRRIWDAPADTVRCKLSRATRHDGLERLTFDVDARVGFHRRDGMFTVVFPIDQGGWMLHDALLVLFRVLRAALSMPACPFLNYDMLSLTSRRTGPQHEGTELRIDGRRVWTDGMP